MNIHRVIDFGGRAILADSGDSRFWVCAHNSHAFRPFADTSLVEAQDLAGSKDWPRGLRRGRKKECGNFSKIQGAKKKKISSQASA